MGPGFLVFCISKQNNRVKHFLLSSTSSFEALDSGTTMPVSSSDYRKLLKRTSILRGQDLQSVSQFPPRQNWSCCWVKHLLCLSLLPGNDFGTESFCR